MTTDIHKLTQRIFALSRVNAQGHESWADVLGTVGESSGVQSRVVRYVDLGHSTAYLQFFSMSSGFAEFAHANRQPLAETMGIKSKWDPREWAAQQVREYPQDPHWRHLALVENIGVAFSKVSRGAPFAACPSTLYPILRWLSSTRGT